MAVMAQRAAWRVLALVLLAAAGRAAVPPPVASVATNASELWFPVGEVLRYRVYWGVIPVGETWTTTSWLETNGQRRLVVAYHARSNRVLRQIYPVDDEMTATIDTNSFVPVSFCMDMKEGRHSRYEITTFDRAAGKATWMATRSNKTRQFTIDADTRDLVTFMYYMRKEGFPPGTNRVFRIAAGSGVGSLKIQAGARERVSVPDHGEVDCIRLTPTLDFEGLFVSTGAITAWISDDRRCICTRGTASLPLGSIKAVLIDVQGPDSDHWPAASRTPRQPGKE